MMTQFPTLIVGIGNTLLGDEGVGSQAVNQLRQLNLPRDVSLVQCGTDLLSVASVFKGQRRVLVVDAIQKGEEPGTIHIMRESGFRGADMKTTSAHHISAVESAMLLKQLPEFSSTEFIFAGIEPANMAAGNELSPCVQAALPLLLKEILALLHN